MSLENKIVLYIPEVGIKPFVQGMAVLGDASKRSGNKVFITHCTGQMWRCPMMTMNNIMPSDWKEKRKSCKKCNKSFKCLQKEYDFESIELSDLIDSSLHDDIDKYIDKHIDNLENIKYEGFDVGKISQYDFILETKYPYYDGLTKEHKDIYLSYIKNTIISLIIANKICGKYNPDLLLTFNEYSQCQAVRYSANMNDVRRMAMTYPVHYNVDTSRFVIWDTTCEYWRYRHCQNWHKGKDIPIHGVDVMECWKDSIFRMYSSGSHIFSAKKINKTDDILNTLDLDPNKKTIVVYPSSQDERHSVEIAMNMWGENNNVSDAFSDQIEWLSFLLEYSKRRDDIQIVVRIHPREGTRGGGFDSSHLMELRKKFKDDEKSFKIIWPDSPISSYDLMELADICLVSWSLMGIEAARLGIPVLAYTANMFYPDDDFIQVAKTEEDYKHKLDKILVMDYTWDHLVKAVRFYHWRIFVSSLYLEELYTNDDWKHATPSNAKVINNILSGDKDLIEHNIEKWQRTLPEDAGKLEIEAMKKGIRFFIDNVFKCSTLATPKNSLINKLVKKVKTLFHSLDNNERTFVDYDLHIMYGSHDIEEVLRKTKENNRKRILIVDNKEVLFVGNGISFKRYSPVMVRLAKLYDSSNI